MNAAVKHQPATPLPWMQPGSDGGEFVICSDGSHGKRRTVAHAYEPTNAAYIAHAANAYPKLVEALASFLRAPSIGSHGPGSVTIEVQSFNREAAVTLLRELGEEAS